MAQPDPMDLGGLAKNALYEWSEEQGRFIPVYNAVQPVTIEVSAAGNNLVFDTPAGKHLRVFWLSAQSVNANGDTPTEVKFRRGPNTGALTDIYHHELLGGQPWPHRAQIDCDPGDKLWVWLSGARRHLINADVRLYQ